MRLMCMRTAFCLLELRSRLSKPQQHSCYQKHLCLYTQHITNQDMTIEHALQASLQDYLDVRPQPSYH